MRSILGKIKRSVRNQLLIWNNYRLDKKKYKLWASPFREFKTKEQREAYILMLAHSIEKGLAFTELKPWFGKAKVFDLIDQLKKYESETKSHWVMALAIKCLKGYLEVNVKSEKNDDEMKKIICNAINHFSEIELNQKGGIKNIYKNEIIKSSSTATDMFFKTRFSIRDFSLEPVEVKEIKDAIQLAQNTPSVCNRQAVTVHAFEQGDLANKILACQKGNSGFGYKANKILIVTSDLQCFLSVGERNQPWIDGGLFAMTLIWALHNKGLATCCLNWSATHKQDQELRTTIDLPDNEVVIMLLAVGKIPEKVKVPESQRRPIDEIFTYY